jgi:hypothetical protein
MRFLSFAAALALAFPAAAQPQLQSSVEQFDRFATETALLPTDDRVQRFRTEFNRIVPGFYEPRNGMPEARYRERVARALAYYPQHRPKILAAAATFEATYAGATTRFRTFFPDYEMTMPLYLLHSLGEMDGGTREIRGAVIGVFGADVIARYHDPTTIGPFLDHELFHFHHRRFFQDCDAVWCNLWSEGLATYVAARLNPGSTDRMLLLTIPRPIRPEVEPRLREAMCLASAKFESTAPADYAPFFQYGQGGGGTFPPRFGYFLGMVLAEKLGKDMTLDALAKLPNDQVKARLQAALGEYNCAG